MDYRLQLQNLRQALIDQRMSVMIGAGFSKNVSWRFPGWAQLLEDLVFELFSDEIGKVLEDISDVGNRKKVRSEEIQKWIRKEGYLKVVSKYFEYKGFEEVMVLYIEERTPVIQGEDDRYYLIEDGARVPLEAGQLRLHKMLLELPWNNVYTTNYDPLLEASVDISVHKTKTNENEELRRAMADLEKKIVPLKAEREDHIIERDKIMVVQKERMEKGPIEREKFLNPEEEDRLKWLGGEIYRLVVELYPLENRRRDVQKTLSRNISILNQSYTLVTSGPELGLKRNKNIIKLHGSLRSASERKEGKYGFDRDPRKQYVISVEHYEQYPEKHEAFTQLMRISLLQESFCLIGFSGDDPNFLGWIRWVRDLLFRSSTTGSGQEYKIYLLDVSDQEAPADKTLFYENHRIVRVPLLKDEVVDFLEKETEIKLDNRKAIPQVLDLFLRYLYGHDQIISPVVPSDLRRTTKWREAWEQLFDRQDPYNIITDKVVEAARQISDLSGAINRLDLNNWDNEPQLRWLHVLHDQHFEVPGAPQDVVEALVLEAVRTAGTPAPYLLGNELFPQYRKRLGVLGQRDEVLANPSSAENISDGYALLLQLAYTFQFSRLKEGLLVWDAPTGELHLKAGLLALFDGDEAVRLVERELSSSELSDQEKLTSSELLLMLQKVTADTRKADRLKEQIGRFKAAGYVSLRKRLSALIDMIKGSPEKRKPRGADRFSFNHTIVLSKHSKVMEALQVLALAADLGFPFALPGGVLVSSDDFSEVFRIGVRYAPMPFVFYAVQFGNENLLRRMGQEMAANEYLRKELGDILTSVLHDVSEAPGRLYTGLLALAAELFIAVEPDVWEQRYYAIFHELLVQNRLWNRLTDVFQTFIFNGFRFIDDASVLSDIIVDLLGVLDTNASSVISFLAELNRNDLLTVLLRGNVPEKLVQALDDLMERFDERVEDSIFSLGNLHKILPGAMVEKVATKLTDVNFGELSSGNVFKAALFFAGMNEPIRKAIVEGVLRHRALWATGVTSHSIQHPPSYLDLLFLTDKVNRRNGLSLSQGDVLSAFDRLKEAATELRGVVGTKVEADFFSILLGQMFDFLNAYRSELEGVAGFEEEFRYVTELFEKAVGYRDMAEGLTSRDKSAVLFSLADLSGTIERGTANEHALRLLMTKVLMQAEPALEASVNYLGAWMVDLQNQRLFGGYAEVLGGIVKRYWESELSELDVPFMKEMLVRIAFGMRRYGMETEYVRKWIEYGETSPYNNVRQWLRAQE